MAFQFPWTNLHELNLDWFLSKFKQFTANYLGTTATVEIIPYTEQPEVTVTGGTLDDDTDIVDPFTFNFKLPISQSGAVDSVNGQTGVVVLDASDVGAYALPVGGIPESDLSNSVQASLNKADSALQSYTETGPVFSNSVAHSITATDIENWNTVSSSEFKTALLNCFKKVAWISEDGRTAYTALAQALGEYYPGYTFYDYITLTLNPGQALGHANMLMTDIALSSDYEISTSVYYSTGTIDGAQCVMGTRDGGSTKQFALFVTANTGKLGFWYGNTDTTTNIMGVQIGSINTIVIKPVGKSELYPNNAVIVLNGTEYNTGSTATGQTWKSWLGFFGYETSATTGVSQSYNSNRICETIVKNASNTIIHDLCPVFNGTYYGLLDTVTGQFYYNANNSFYTCGNF